MKDIIVVTAMVVVIASGLLYINDRVKTYDIFGHTVTVIK